MKKLILFDIDGTLIHTGGAGTMSMNLAFRELFGVDDAFKNIPMAGKTDMQIMREGLMTHGVPEPDGKLENMINTYLRFLKTEIDNPMRTIKPGIQAVLELLRDMNTPLGLLTGNLEKGARIKLKAFGLNDYFPDGAFGSDHEDRDMLLPIAIEKFSKRGFTFAPEDCVVIGDTPRDVKCAKVHGARCIAVATGPYSKDDLLATDADVVFDSLRDVDRCMEFINRVS
ncbi:MAG TPA: HAD family hydrolase [Nitrospirae bacterium]|nr:HAD family hydrolase [Nitrospirota bacterium]HDK81662.1 HAD family hydrolase [Nitrospirota bacterium]HDO25485.1 HAD family hydrolase [Nitrospirota bacterium]